MGWECLIDGSRFQLPTDRCPKVISLSIYLGDLSSRLGASLGLGIIGSGLVQQTAITVPPEREDNRKLEAYATWVSFQLADSHCLVTVATSVT